MRVEYTLQTRELLDNLKLTYADDTYVIPLHHKKGYKRYLSKCPDSSVNEAITWLISVCLTYVVTPKCVLGSFSVHYAFHHLIGLLDTAYTVLYSFTRLLNDTIRNHKQGNPKIT